MNKTVTISQKQLEVIYTALRIERERANAEGRESDYVMLDDAVSLIYAQL